jgi:hypothetical protein
VTFQIPSGHKWNTDSFLGVGRWACEVEAVNDGVSKGKQSPQFIIRSRCTQEGEANGRITLDYVPKQDNCLFRLQPYAIAAGLIDPEDPQGSQWREGVKADEQDLVGAPVWITIVEEPPNEFHSKPKPTIDRVEPRE